MSVLARSSIRAGLVSVALVASVAADAAVRGAEAVFGDRVLTIDVPDGYEASSGPGGIILRPINHRERRVAHEIAVTLGPVDPATPSLAGTRALGGRSARYRLDRHPGGSGGAEIVLIAELPCAAWLIRLRFDTQAEDEPDFGPAWAALASARCRSSNTRSPGDREAIPPGRN